MHTVLSRDEDTVGKILGLHGTYGYFCVHMVAQDVYKGACTATLYRKVWAAQKQYDHNSKPSVIAIS